MGELTVSIAHEMAQPLMAIESNATTCMRWLADEQLNLGQARQAAERIVGDVHRARDVIASIRGLARKSVSQMLRLDLNTVVKETLDLTRNEVERQGISLETELEGGAPVLGVRVQLQQVMLNLVINAIEAIVAAPSTARHLKIRSALAGSLVTVSVADTGAGVDPVNREKVFDPFYTTKPEGLGLGLSICRSIVEAHGGRLWINPNPGGGTIFTFSIPLTEEGVQAAQEILVRGQKDSVPLSGSLGAGR
jgi:signal transduction histidine kinase